MTIRDLPSDDLAAIAADDALVDALADGAFGDDELSQLLGAWRTELDEALATVTPERERRRVIGWIHRHTAGVAVATVVTVVASTGAAAAASGPTGPFAGLHRALFGTSTPVHDDVDPTVATVTTLLDAVAADIRRAHNAGGVTSAQRADLTDQLDTAQALIAADPGAPAGLTSRLDRLRADLAALQTLHPQSPDGHSGGQAVRPGHDGSEETSGGDGSHEDSTSSGSDDGSSTSGSDDGSSTSGGSDDGSSSPSTDTSGSTDGGDGGSGSTSSGDTSGSGSTDGGSTDGGSTDGGSTDGGTSGGGSTDGG